MWKPKNLDQYIPAAKAAEQLARFAAELKRTVSKTELIRWTLRVDRYDSSLPK